MSEDNELELGTSHWSRALCHELHGPGLHEVAQNPQSGTELSQHWAREHLPGHRGGSGDRDAPQVPC